MKGLNKRASGLRCEHEDGEFEPFLLVTDIGTGFTCAIGEEGDNKSEFDGGSGDEGCSAIDAGLKSEIRTKKILSCSQALSFDFNS